MGKHGGVGSPQKRCPHVKDKANHKKLRTVLEKGNGLQPCVQCKSAVRRANHAVCLKCGLVLCDADINDHASKHAQSKNHYIALHMKTLRCWCFKCDREISSEEHDTLRQCIDFVTGVRKEFFDVEELDGDMSANILSQSAPVSPAASVNKSFSYHSTQRPKQLSVGTGSPVKGLKNLGNTCYFNSVLQCLAQISLLQEALEQLYGKHPLPPVEPTDPEHSLDSTVSSSGPIHIVPSAPFAKAMELKETLEPITLERDSADGIVGREMHALLADMNAPVGSTANPAPLLRSVCSKAPRFRGRQQQDSQELFGCVLDCLDEEEKQRSRPYLLDKFDCEYDATKSLGMNIRELDKTAQKKVIVYNRSISTYVDSIFGGQLASFVRCEHCGKVTKTVDSFLDLSLPIVKGPVKKEKPPSSKARPPPSSKANSSAGDAKPKEPSSAKELTANDGASTVKDDGLAEDVSVMSLNDKPNANSGETAAGNGNTAIDTATLGRPKTAAPPYQASSGECSIQSCFAAFCTEERLDGDNAFFCEHCCKPQVKGDEGDGAASKDVPEEKIRRPAVKQLLIDATPRILVVHIKRFEQHGTRLTKSNQHVSFPTELDIAPFCTESCPQSVYADGVCGVMYGLCGVVVHIGKGSLHAGHYIAYVKSHGSWFYVSDLQVKPAQESDVLRAQAYLLFYERLH